jgi:hypothetical protein
LTNSGVGFGSGYAAGGLGNNAALPPAPTGDGESVPAIAYGAPPAPAEAFKGALGGGGTRKRLLRRTVTRQEDGFAPDEPRPDLPYPDFLPPPTHGFYYDYWLDLWVEFHHSDTTTRYDYYEDEAKTKKAGFSVSSYPADWRTFPQEYVYRYEFTAGLMKGAHGHSRTTTNAGWSGTSEYENVYADGWRDSGAGNWDGRGFSSWTSRTEAPDGSWIEVDATFRANGSGGMRIKMSTGYEAVYTYNANGSGRARITGPGPEYPITITWDQHGNTTIQHPDGRVEKIPGWGFVGPWPWIGGGIAIDDPVPATGDGTGGTSSGGGNSRE